jgi:hypothetical protein
MHDEGDMEHMVLLNGTIYPAESDWLMDWNENRRIGDTKH